MKVNFTDTHLRNLKSPPSGRTYINDAKQPGLRLCVSSTGSKVWSVQKKIKGGKRIFITLGSYPSITLKCARDEAYRLQAEAEAGIDRIEEQAIAKAKAEAEARAARSVSDVLDLYISMHVDRNLKEGAPRADRKAQLRKHLKDFATLPVEAVTKADLQRVIDAKAAEGSPIMANRIRAAFTAFFGWLYRRGYIERNPAEHLQKTTKEKPRTRTPTLEEVREIYEATKAIGQLWGPFFRLCILTGQRSRSDVMAMQWEWIDWDKCRYSIPSPKNGQPHIVHLGPDAMAELQALRPTPDASGKPDYLRGPVFTTTGITPSSGFAKAKRHLDKAIDTARSLAGRPPMPHWRTHDLRRAQATALAEAGFDEGVVDRIQNHVAGGSRPSAVSHVYNRAQKLNERAKALNAWSDMVLGRCETILELAAMAPETNKKLKHLTSSHQQTY
jgi:integrase